MYFVFSPWIFAGVLLAVITLTGISYWISAHAGDIGSTSELAAILTFLLGALTFLGLIEASLVITVIAVVFLSAKLKLQSVIGQITPNEMYDFIRFAVVAILIFPFLPNVSYGPFEVFNPREIGLVILLISAVGFVGYVLMRILGTHQGILATGILGGLVSSTMVTWVFSRKSKEYPALSSHCATAIFAASSIMIIRVLLWVMIFNKSLLPGLALGIGIIFLTSLGVTFYWHRHGKNKKAMDAGMPLGRPLNLISALFFGVLYVVILYVVAFAESSFGEKGIFISSGIAGLSDVDAITISVSKLATHSLGSVTAQNAILIATLSNTLVKIAIALWAGSKELIRYIYTGYGIIFLAGIIAFILLNV
jgi:uncharacterized membrane protein (DUF4010 family)